MSYTVSMEFRKILVPVDGSKGANAAVVFAAKLAQATGAELTLLHVFDNMAAAAIGLHQLPKAEVEQTVQRVAQGSFESAQAALKEVGSVTAHTKVGLGDPAKEIVAVAKADQVDLVVMGTRGLSPVKELLLGSVSETVIRTAPCPVTVVR